MARASILRGLLDGERNVKKSEAKVGSRSAAGKKITTARRAGSPSARASSENPKSNKARAQAASKRPSGKLKGADNRRSRTNPKSVARRKQGASANAKVDCASAFDSTPVSSTKADEAPQTDSNPIPVWTMHTRSKRIFNISGVGQTFATRDAAIELYWRVCANDKDIVTVSLTCPDGSSEDLKFNGTHIKSTRRLADSETKDGFWRIWDMRGSIVGGGRYRYPAALATFDACWRNDPKILNVFLVEDCVEDHKPREFWLKRNGRVVI